MLQDLRYALRQLLKNPGFSIVAILTLALAIGANTAIFSAIDAVLLHPLPYPEPGQLVFVGEDLKHFNLAKIPASPPEVNDYRNMATSFSAIGAVENSTAFTLTGSGSPEIIPGMSVTASMFSMLGVKPVVGGLFTAEAEQPGKNHVAVISEGLWKRRFGADPSIAGKKIEINRESYVVMGVIEPILEFRLLGDIWTPIAFTPAQLASFESSLLERAASLPGVVKASAIDLLPFSGQYSAGSFEIVGHPHDPRAPQPVVIKSLAAPGYLEALGIPLIRGRWFTGADVSGSTPVAVIDETVARKFFSNFDPIGMQITSPKDGMNCTIVGIAPVERHFTDAWGFTAPNYSRGHSASYEPSGTSSAAPSTHSA